MLDKDKNAINNGKHVLFHLSKYSGKLYDNIVYKMQIQIFFPKIVNGFKPLAIFANKLHHRCLTRF